MTILEDEEMNESLSKQLQSMTTGRKPAAGRNQATGRKATRGTKATRGVDRKARGTKASHKPLRLNKNGIPMETERPPFTRGITSQCQQQNKTHKGRMTDAN